MTDLTVTGDLRVDQNTFCSGSLFMGKFARVGPLAVQGIATVAEGMTVGGDLTVSEDVLVGRTLTVQGQPVALAQPSSLLKLTYKLSLDDLGTPSKVLSYLTYELVSGTGTNTSQSVHGVNVLASSTVTGNATLTVNALSPANSSVAYSLSGFVSKIFAGEIAVGTRDQPLSTLAQAPCTLSVRSPAMPPGGVTALDVDLIVYLYIEQTEGGSAPPPSLCPAFQSQIFRTCADFPAGDCVAEFWPSATAAADVKAALDAAAAGQVTRAWSYKSYAILLHPGTYDFGGATLPVAFNTSLRGLGRSASDVLLKNCLVTIPGCPDQCPPHVTDIFWRDIENLKVEGTVDWFTSQACPLRRVEATGTIFLDSDKIESMWASGGFLGDTKAPTIYSRTQQQFCFKNITCPQLTITGGMNWVYVNSTTPAGSQCGNGRSIYVKDGLLAPKKPFLVENGICKPVPAMDAGAALGSEPLLAGSGSSCIFYPGATAAEINAKKSKYIILTSGRYVFTEPLTLDQDDSVLLGVGWPIISNASSLPSVIVTGSRCAVSSLMLEAGTDGNPPSLLHLAAPGIASELFDVFARILTPEDGSKTSRCKTMITVDQAGAYVENLWLWRADHEHPVPVDWSRMDNPTGLEVNSDRVVAVGLAVEHQTSTMVEWKGTNGRCYFYQSEFTYSPPTDGAPSYLVTGSGHRIHGGGVYYVKEDAGQMIFETAYDVLPDTTVNPSLGKNWNPLSGLKHTLRQNGALVPSTPFGPAGLYTVC